MSFVTFPDLPHAHTDGEGMRDAMEEAIDCLAA
jgi:predicted RNase H-like HicB family nuclease